MRRHPGQSGTESKRHHVHAIGPDTERGRHRAILHDSANLQAERSAG
jgi:hypothetical protein